MNNNLFPYIIGIIIGLCIGYLIFGTTIYGDRYSMSVSSDGAVAHKLDKRTGRAWIKSGYTEPGPDGNPITVYFWEELYTDKPVAAAKAKGKAEREIAEKEAELEMKRAAETEEFELKQTRIKDISGLCGEDMVCVQEKCSTGFHGTPDPEWSEYCSQTIYTNLAKLVISQCEGRIECIKDYCKEKHNNTYPAVSDCVQDINLVKIKSETQ